MPHQAQIQTLTVDLSNLRKITNPWAYELFGNMHRNLVLQGGAGSGKSVFAAQKCVLRCIIEPNHHICCFRKVASSVMVSIWPQLLAAIEATGTSRFWVQNKTEHTLTYTPNGSKLRCLGLDDPEKLKSIHNMTSAWIEEATEFYEGDFKQINLRLRGISRYYKQIIISFNPINVLHWLKKRFVDNFQPQRDYVCKTTFLDNNFIDDDYASELRAYEKTDPYVWKVYGLGDWGHSEGLVYKYPTVLDPAQFPPMSVFTTTIYGLDWGYNVPTALVRVMLMPNIPKFALWLASVRNPHPTLCAYAKFLKLPGYTKMTDLDAEPTPNEETFPNVAFIATQVYRANLTTPQLTEEIKRKGIKYWERIYADPAEPGSIQELADQGFNVVPAEKGQGSIIGGVRHCKGFHIFTSSDDVDLNNEFSLYHWKQSKEKMTDEPADAFNHGMDAMRYALWTHGLETGTVRVGRL